MITPATHTAQPLPSSHQTDVTIGGVGGQDAVPVTPPHSRHVTFAEIPFSTPSSEDVLFRGRFSQPSMPLEPEPPEHEDFNDVFQVPLSTGSCASVRSTSFFSQHHHDSSIPSTPTPSHRNHGRQNHTPRAGPHSTRRSAHSSGPAGNRTGHKANDVYTFFTKEDDRHYCMFCR